MLFAYPQKAFFGRVLPKNKIYANARISTALKRKFIDQIEKIVWEYKLSPETINLPGKKTAPEIEIFTITLRQSEIREDVLRCIDNAIPFPIIYEFVFEKQIKTKAAFKRPSEGDSNKWVTEIYFESDWQRVDAERDILPIALDLEVLYEKILRSLMPNSKVGEDLREQVQRLTEMRALQNEAEKLESKIRKEKQFNRKVELNAELRKLKNELAELRS